MEIHPTPITQNKSEPIPAFPSQHPLSNAASCQGLKASKRSFPPVLVLARFASFHQRRRAPHLGPTPPDLAIYTPRPPYFSASVRSRRRRLFDRVLHRLIRRLFADLLLYQRID